MSNETIALILIVIVALISFGSLIVVLANINDRPDPEAPDCALTGLTGKHEQLGDEFGIRPLPEAQPPNLTREPRT